MTYSESAKRVTITADRAKQELAKHGSDQPHDWQAFVEDMGDKPTYKASDVLEWLGY